MKKLLLTGVLVACFTIANAQTEQGSWLVGGSSSFSYGSQKYNGTSIKDTNLNLQLTAGNFIAENFVLGLFLGVNTYKNGFSGSKTTTTVFGPLGRYYVDGTFFLGAGYVITKSKFKNDFGDDESSFNQVRLEAGYPIWIKENIAIEPGLNYLIGVGDYDGVNTLALGIGFSLYL